MLTLFPFSPFFSNIDLPECKELMARFIAEKPDVWWEDVGEEDPAIPLPAATQTEIAQ